MRVQLALTLVDWQLATQASRKGRKVGLAGRIGVYSVLAGRLIRRLGWRSDCQTGGELKRGEGRHAGRQAAAVRH